MKFKHVILEIMASMLLVSCGNESFSSTTNSSNSGSTSSSHTHTFASGWENDETYHWHKSTCEHDVVSGKEKHTFKEQAIGATYDADGYTLYTCEVCDYSYKDNVTEKLAHNYASTWSNDGDSHWHACTDKGYETLKKDEARHSFKDEVASPTFESGGYTTHTCTVCGYSYSDSQTSKLAHNYASTWSNDGDSHWHACTDKGYETLKKDEARHSFKDEVASPTFESGGYTTHTCTVCGYSYSDSQTSKLDHNYSSNWSYNSTSHWHACTDEGYESLYTKKAYHSFDDDGKCKVCGHTVGTSDKLKFELNEDLESYSVIGVGSETATNFAIPSTYNGKPVTSIGPQAFSDCDIVSLSIPDSVTKIERYAFYDCKKLTNITLSNNLTFYGNYAIGSCDSLEYNEFEGAKYLGSFTNPYLVLIESISKDISSVNINENCRIIANKAFYDCDNLTNISIPASVMSISSSAFKCKNLASIAVDSNNKIYDSRNNCNALLETANNKLILGCKSTIIPNGITTIGDSAFLDCTGLTELKFPDSVTTIGNSAFARCTGLTGQLVIPENVTYLGPSAFYGCGFTSIKLLCSLNKLPKYVFAECKNLKEITIVGKIESINYSAFSNTFYVESIYFNGDIKGWLSTNTDNLPDFSDLYLLDDNGTEEHDGQKYCHVEGDLIIPDDPNLTIGECSFRGLKDITSVKIPANVTKIADGAFSGCTNLASIIVDENNEYYDSRNNCNAIITKENNALIQGCKSTVIPEGVTSIGSYTFCNCGSPTDVTIPEGVTTIKECAFYNCSSLTNIIIPKSLTSVGRVAFYGCGLQAVYFAGTYEEMASYYIFPGTFYVDWSNVYYYSESKPDNDKFNYWHYSDNGSIVNW